MRKLLKMLFLGFENEGKRLMLKFVKLRMRLSRKFGLLEKWDLECF